MGVDWELYCRDCDSVTEGNGSDVRLWQLKEIWSARRAIAEIVRCDNFAIFDLTLARGGVYSGWIVEHADHRVAYRSEHGEVREIDQPEPAP